MLSAKPIAEITAPQLLAMAKRIEARGALDIAKRCLQTCGQIFRYAVAHGVLERNPAADVRPSDALKPRKKENFARLDAKELPELLRKIEAYQGSAITRLALKLVALTFVRTSELIGAAWDVASTILHEYGFDHMHIELQLAHMERDAVAAAYNHATYLTQRRQMMQWYADHLDAMRKRAKVVSLRTA
jgi:hypothetical protein